MDWSIANSKATKKLVKGRIRKIYSPADANVSPLSNYYTATLKIKRETVYLKFPTEAELKRQSIVENEVVVVEGDLRIIDGKKILTNVKRVPEPQF